MSHPADQGTAESVESAKELGLSLASSNPYTLSIQALKPQKQRRACLLRLPRC